MITNVIERDRILVRIERRFRWRLLFALNAALYALCSLPLLLNLLTENSADFTLLAGLLAVWLPFLTLHAVSYLLYEMRERSLERAAARALVYVEDRAPRGDSVRVVDLYPALPPPDRSLPCE